MAVGDVKQVVEGAWVRHRLRIVFCLHFVLISWATLGHWAHSVSRVIINLNCNCSFEGTACSQQSLVGLSSVGPGLASGDRMYYSHQKLVISNCGCILKAAKGPDTMATTIVSGGCEIISWGDFMSLQLNCISHKKNLYPPLLHFIISILETILFELIYLILCSES